MYTLVIGNRNYSSWSLRAWLHLKASGIDCEVVRIPLYSDNYKEKVMEYSPAGRVPVLVDDTVSPSISVWDSLAIMEHVLEQQQTAAAVGWPQDLADRALARSISYEMHSGFLAIRDELPQNLRMRKTLTAEQLSESCQQQIARVDEIWKSCYAKHASSAKKWLFGDEMTIADIMFAPVALRFVSYGIKVSAESQKFIDAVVGNEFVQEWIELAKQETLDFIDNLVPAAESPLIL